MYIELIDESDELKCKVINTNAFDYFQVLQTPSIHSNEWGLYGVKISSTDHSPIIANTKYCIKPENAKT